MEQSGGRYAQNSRGSYHFEPAVRVVLYLPNGDRITHSGASVREMEPYDGYLDMHIAQTGLHRQELWANGQLKQAGEWKRE